MEASRFHWGETFADDGLLVLLVLRLVLVAPPETAMTPSLVAVLVLLAAPAPGGYGSAWGQDERNPREAG